jgi:RNA polymerase sigma-70 factor (ECF subfamily)
MVTDSNLAHLNFEENRLLTLLQEDSEYAFQLIYDKHRNRIYKTAIKFLKSPIIAQDVVQDVFLKLWFERKTINPAKPVEAWLYTVAKNNILNKLRKIANEWKALDMLSDSFLDSENSTEDKLVKSELNTNLEKALSQLSDQQKLVFILSRYEKLTYIQIGQKMGISPLTVKTHLSRALYSIKKQFESSGVLFIGAIFYHFQ